MCALGALPNGAIGRVCCTWEYVAQVAHKTGDCLFLSPIRLRLQPKQLGIKPTPPHQLAMATHLHNLPTTEDDDQIRHLHRRKAVRDEHGHRTGALAQFMGGAGPPFKEAMFRFGIERSGWFIEQQEEGGRAHHRLPNCQLLPLATGEVNAIRPLWTQLGCQPLG